MSLFRDGRKKKHTTPDEDRQIAAINGDILVARTLARTCLGANTPELESATELARHCQLLCSRSKLSPIQAHLADLAAWLSVLAADKEHVARHLSARHGLDEVVFGDPKEHPRIEHEIFSLARRYQDLKKKDPSIAENRAMVRRQLDREWAQSDDQKSLVRRFANVVRDEEFLARSRTVAGQILIVDPEEKVAPVLSSPLSNHGYDVTVVDNVDSAREILTESPPDIILAEMDMPITSGLAFCEDAKSDPTTFGIPFILMSAKKSKAAARNCLRKGANDFVPKPVDLELLFLKLVNLVTAKPAEADQKEGGVSGALTEMPFTDMVQIVCAGGKSMIITLKKEGMDGEVAIVNGHVVHAALGDKEGDDAFYDLMAWQEGDFTTRTCEDYPKRTVQTSLMSLLMEGARLADEAAEANAAQ